MLVVLCEWHIMPLAVLLSCLGGAARAVVTVCLMCFSYLISYGIDWYGFGVGCGSNYASVTCDGGIVMLSIGCDDSTCGNCSRTMDYTAYTDGSYTCEDSYPSYYYINGATKWYLPQPGCFRDESNDDGCFDVDLGVMDSNGGN